MSDEKRLFGQFYTISNPFELNVFVKWLRSIKGIDEEIFLEPFAGANNIVEMIQELGCNKYQKWDCYDICPAVENKVPEFVVKNRDTIDNFPTGYRIAITNPPYLAKNSATRRGLDYAGGEYDDLYKKALEVMLENCEYVAAIIPESFITSNLFHNRLEIVISLTCKMFDDTECPVCLALFSPDNGSNDFKVYRQDKYINNYSELKKCLFQNNKKFQWKINDPNGEVGIKCVDSISGRSIKFIKGPEIKSEEIKSTSRAYTRVSGLPQGVDLNKFIALCNEKLENYRNLTNDVFLTSFKGLRKDGYYRRRLDFNTAKLIMSAVLEELNGGM